MSKMIMVSGGFDPIHIGHIQMIKEAARMAPVIVAVNSDKWLMRKKGYVFMPFRERCAIIEAIRGVERVVGFDDSDDTAIDALRTFKPGYFANGGDRKIGSVPEEDYCLNNGIDMLWQMGGNDKPQSSSWLVNKAMEQLRGSTD